MPMEFHCPATCFFMFCHLNPSPLKMWSWDQPHQHHPGVCEMPNLKLQANQTGPVCIFNKIPRWFAKMLKFEECWYDLNYPTS